MIDALITGKLHAPASKLTSKAGNPFVKVRLIVHSADGGSLFVGLVAFDDTVQGELMAMSQGDSVAVAATLTPRAYIDRNGEAAPAMEGIAHHVTSPYHIRKKRKAMPTGKEQPAGHAPGGVLDIQDDPL